MDLLRKIVASPAVRKALAALVFAILAAAGISFGAGCGSAVPPAVSAAQATLRCQHAVLESVVSREQAQALLREAHARDVEAVARRLIGLGVTPARVRQAVDEIRACAAAPEPAESDAGASDAGE